MLSVTLGSLNDIQVPGGKSVLVPLTGVDTVGQPITYSFNSSDPNVQLSLVSPTSKSLVLNVTGTDSGNNAFTGTLVLHLFEDLAPETTARIEQLVTQGYYDGLDFSRVLDGFVAQTGETNGGNDTGILLDDEFNPSLSFTSPGLLAMANRGPDTSDAEFFITAIDGTGTTDSITLANMPQFLDFRYTVFGQLVSGFDTFEKIMSTTVTTNSQSGEDSQPTHPITVTSASLLDDSQDAVLRVFAPAGFDGNSATITVTATNADNESSQQSFLASAVTDTNLDPPFLGPVDNQVTTVGKSISFSLTSTDVSGAGVFYFLVDPNTLSDPANATVNLNQTTGEVTLTPNPGFSGTINLVALVRASTQDNTLTNFDTQEFSVNVVAPTLNPVDNQTTTAGVSDVFTLTATDSLGNNLAYSVVDATTLTAPTDVDVAIDQATGQVTLTPHAGFQGTENLLAGARDINSPDVQTNYTTQSFALNVVALDPVSEQLTSPGVPISVTLSVSPSGGDMVYAIVDPNTFAAPTNVTISIDQATGAATLTPNPGFVGTINLRAGVRAETADDDPANYDTQDFTLDVAVATLGTVGNQTTTVGAPVSFTVTSTDPVGAGVVYSIVDPDTLAAPAHVSVNIDQATGTVTLTPTADFGGVIHLRARARLAGASDTSENYVTQDFTLSVNSDVSLGPLNDIQVPGGKSVLVPLTGVDTAGQPITYSFNSSDPNVQLSLVSPTSKSLVLNVTGTDSGNNAFTGTLVLHLFEDLSPETTTRIEQLVNQGYYNGLDFFRVLDGFMAQAGNNGAGDTGVQLDDEFDPSLTFTSAGLLAMANRGPDTSDAEFFITAIDATGTADPIMLEAMPQFLDFHYTIFGQLVSGFDTFEKMMSTTVTTNSDSGETSQPVNSITITSASLIDDTQNAVLRVTAPASFDGSSATITVTATNATGQSSQTAFSASVESDSVTDPPFLGNVANQSTTTNTPSVLSLTSTDLSGGGVFYTVVDPTTFSSPTNVTVSIDQTTGQVTLTPAAGFNGTINLLAGVRALSAADSQASYDTQAFTLTVNSGTTTGDAPAAPTGLAVDSASDTGAFDGSGYITTGTPMLTVTAESGATVQYKLNGAIVATATETTSGSGNYIATLPAGVLAVGSNTITAVASDDTGSSVDSAAMSLIYAPDYAGGVYFVPGAVGTSQTMTFAWTAKNAAYNNEFGFFIVDSSDGTIGGVAPGDAGYADAALSSGTRQIIFSKGQNAGADMNVTLQGGQMIVFYLIQNNTTADFLAKNPSDTNQGNAKPSAPLAFFSLETANPDGMKHTQIIADPTTGYVQYNWEDSVDLGDSDFNDATIAVHLSGTTSQPATLHAPGADTTSVSLGATLQSGKQSSPAGDIGVYFVDDEDGTVNGLHPGDSGYAVAALAAGNFQVLFGPGASGTNQVSVPAGEYLAFYTITNGTTTDFTVDNPTNGASGAMALFSFDDANPDSTNHFRWYTPGQQSTNPDVVELHVMTKCSGKASDFDSFAIDLSFSA